MATVSVRVTLMTTPLRGVANVGWFAATDRAVILANLTVSVCPTRSTNLLSSEPPAVPERISCCSPGTPADSHVVLHGAVSPLATRQAAGVHSQSSHHTPPVYSLYRGYPGVLADTCTQGVLPHSGTRPQHHTHPPHRG